MPLDDALNILQSGRELRGTIEFDKALLSWRVKFDGHRQLTVLLDEIGLDDPIPFEPKEDGEASVDDFPE